jgi:hypothetical protein
MSDYARAHPPAPTPPAFADCELLCFPALSTVCDGYTLTLWRDPATGELWIAEMGGIAGRGGDWFGPIRREDAFATLFAELLPWAFIARVP